MQHRVAGTGQPVTAIYETDGVTPISELRSNAAGQDSPGAIRPFKVADVLGIQYEYNEVRGPVRWFEQGQEVGAAALSGLGGKLDKSGGTITGDLDIAGTLTVGGQPGGPTFLRAHIYNVIDRGAVGNGVADDAPAIQSALNTARDAGGGTVLIPAGQYRLASLPLRIYRNTHLRCLPGARLIRALDTTMLINGDADQAYGIYTGHGSITVEGGTWDMQGTVVTASSMCMSFGHAEGITVRGITVLDLPGYHGVELNAIRNGRVLGSVFRGYINPGSRDLSEAIQIDLAKSHDEFGPFGSRPGCRRARTRSPRRARRQPAGGSSRAAGATTPQSARRSCSGRAAAPTPGSSSPTTRPQSPRSRATPTPVARPRVTGCIERSASVGTPTCTATATPPTPPTPAASSPLTPAG
ncbi:glycosyl hydrolase family 28-related protein [Streptomyces laculatispora]|uniref:glycosyl hydrolase family 28-related protein n=1 Tax=Streptomyces laculatispora TaxID=887464 RepID=UPI003556CCE3